ncbi:MAG: aminofutalosine synthase MqnE [Bdellovibrionales bacterium]|nr:aminofutalosine synthase MqnE [Bdellovibrionales bacterium]
MSTALALIRKKVSKGERLSFDDGMTLFHHENLLEVGGLAHEVRLKLHGKTTYYNWNLHLNSTNVCKDDCMFCSFARLETGMPQAYTMSVADAEKWIRERYRPGMTEIHIVNGNNPDLEFTYYLDLLSMVREKFPGLHIKAFTGVEIHHFAELFDLSYEEILTQLIDAGLGSMPGGGAEIFAERVRKKICRQKANADQWLAVHRTAHRLGLRSNCTMLYGTIERPEEIVDHLLRLRELQDETGGFQVFIPLAFHNDGNRLKNLSAPTAVDDLRIVAVSRLLLDNIPHVKAYWVMLGEKTAQTALLFGANDIDGTVTEEKIYHMAGSRSPNALPLSGIQRLIQRAGLDPVERDTLYHPVVRKNVARENADLTQKPEESSNQASLLDARA